MCAADKEVFSSFAHAQVSITNEIYQYLGEPETFLFCPTGIVYNSFILSLEIHTFQRTMFGLYCAVPSLGCMKIEILFLEDTSQGLKLGPNK